MNTSDVTFLKTLTTPTAPFLDIYRAVYRASRLICETASEALKNGLGQIQMTFGVRLVPQNVCMDSGARPDSPTPWDYAELWVGARIWIPVPVEATLWLCVLFQDDAVLLATGLEFKRRGDRDRFFDNLTEESGITKVEWDHPGLELTRPLNDIAALDAELENLLQEFLSAMPQVGALSAVP